MTNLARARELVEKITYADTAYFEKSEPIMSDEAYDALWFELKEMLDDPQVVKMMKSDAMPLGTALDGSIPKFKHLVPVLSLDKIKAAQIEKEIPKFVKKYETNGEWVIEPKLDGITIVAYITPKGPALVTRGGSQVGEDVTRQFIGDKSLMEGLSSLDPGTIIKGEAVMTKLHFKTHYSNEFANPRNLVSGLVRRKDGDPAWKNGVRIVWYDVLGEVKSGDNEIDQLKYLSNLGLLTVHGFTSYIESEHLVDELSDMISSNYRECYDYPLDGLVVKPDLKIEKPEVNGHHQKGQIAVKFPPAGSETVIREIVWNEGANGTLAPVAIYDQVTVNGNSFNRASLGSWGKIQEKNIKVGDRVWMIVSNDVIPQIERVLEDGGGSTVELPENAILSGGRVLNMSGEIDKPQMLVDYVSKVFNLKGYGRGKLEKLIDAGFDTPAKLLDVDESIVDKTPGWSEKSLKEFNEKLHDRATHGVSFARSLESLSIPSIGKKASEIIAKSLDHSFENLVNDNAVLESTESLSAPTRVALKHLTDSDSEYRIILSELSKRVKFV